MALPLLSSSLKDTHLDYFLAKATTTNGSPSESYDIFPSCPYNLRYLSIRTFGSAFSGLDPFRGLLCEFLRTDLPTHSGRSFLLETLTINLWFQPSNACSLLHRTNFQVHWKALADFMSDKLWFPKLRRVNITLSLNEGNQQAQPPAQTIVCRFPWPITPQPQPPQSQPPPHRRTWDLEMKEEFRGLANVALASLEERGILDFSCNSDCVWSLSSRPKFA